MQYFFPLLIRSLHLALMLGGVFFSCSCSKSSAASTSTVEPVPNDTIQNKPALSGRLVYHSYSCYECNDSKILLYDFAAHSSKILSSGWNIGNPMNAHFSPDGKKIVFMGITPGTGNWDIFTCTLSSSAQPANLSAMHAGGRNEDPKFSSDGSAIIFKNDGVLTLMDTLGNIIARYSTPGGEASMPYFADHNTSILYAAAQNGISSVYRFRTTDSSIQTLYSAAGIYAYYPIARDDSSFFFTRWHSATNHHDQLYLGFFDGRPPLRPGFNEASGDYSDAFPAGKEYLFLSSTRSGGIGGYDLYIAGIYSGAIWSLKLYDNKINTTLNELGACYHE